METLLNRFRSCCSILVYSKLLPHRAVASLPSSYHHRSRTKLAEEGFIPPYPHAGLSAQYYQPGLCEHAVADQFILIHLASLLNT